MRLMPNIFESHHITSPGALMDEESWTSLLTAHVNRTGSSTATLLADCFFGSAIEMAGATTDPKDQAGPAHFREERREGELAIAIGQVKQIQDKAEAMHLSGNAKYSHNP